MSEQQHTGLPVAGYQPQSDDKIATVNQNKTLEEMVLRQIDGLQAANSFDPRWLAIGRAAIEEGFMAINRAVFQPKRVNLPGDPI